MSFADSLDCVGVLGRDVNTVKRVYGLFRAALLLALTLRSNTDILAVYDSRDPTAAPSHVRRKARQLNEGLCENLKGDSLVGLRVGVPQVCSRTLLRLPLPDVYVPRNTSLQNCSQVLSLPRAASWTNYASVEPLSSPFLFLRHRML